MSETFTPFNAFDYLDTVYLCHEYIKACHDDYNKLTRRYDDAMQRINDMQAELEYLRREVNR